jgi:hypothetical protein
MGVVKTVLIFVLLGALLGVAGASVVVPPALSWYNEPGALQKGGHVESIVNVPEVIRYTTDRLIKSQVIGAGIGAVVGLAIGAVTASRGRRRRTAAAPAPAAPAPKP